MLYTQKKNLKGLLASALILLPFTAKAGAFFNEIMPCNISTIITTDDYDFSGYIEFSSTQSAQTNLKGYTICNYKKSGALKWSYDIEGDFPVSNTNFNILWADESTTEGHIPFKIDTDGGSLVLKQGNTVIDSIIYGKQTAHIAFGRSANGTGYMLPTPFAANSASHTTLTRAEKPVFSETGGIKNSAFNLTLNADADTKIYYTTDGTEPGTQSAIYTKPIYIEGNTCVRAIAYSADKLPSPIITHSYIFEDEAHAACGGFGVPIVSLTVDSNYFYGGELGICVAGTNGIGGEKDCVSKRANYNRDWKRPVNFEYFVDGKQVLSQEVEAAVEGGCSRKEAVKSLSLKASKKAGADELAYHFFQAKPKVTHQTVHIRNGGTAYNSVRFRDGLMQTLAIGMNIDYQAYQPVAYYINGKYNGLMALNERTNADYVTANYGLKDDEIDLITISDQLGIRASKGDKVAYDELVTFLSTEDQTSATYFSEACKRMDMDEYIDYQIFQQFIVNTDWPGNNTKIWREKKNNGRFRWILFDTDFGLGLPGYTYLGTNTKNMIDWCRGYGATSWANKQSWMTVIFKNLYKNPEFKRKFVTKYFIRLANDLSSERVNAVFDSITALVDPEYCAHYQSSAISAANSMRTFANGRIKNIPTHLKNCASAKDIIDFVLTADVDDVVFTINGEKVSEFNGKYLSGFNTDIKVYAPEGYAFDHWEFSEDSLFNATEKTEYVSACMAGVLKGQLNKSGTIKAIFSTTPYETPTVVINELCASSNELSNNPDDYNTFPDWIELYNFGEKEIDLAGLSISNNADRLNLSSIPYGTDNTIIKPGEHLVFWAKGNALDGARYLNFKMDIDKPKTIYLSDSKGNIISKADYMYHATNDSWGYMNDNGEEWVVFKHCNNELTATPGEKNSSKECSNGVDVIETTVENVRLYPNPTSDKLTISSDFLIEHVKIRASNGCLVMEQDVQGEEITLEVGNLSKGVYFVEVRSTDNNQRLKLIKE